VKKTVKKGDKKDRKKEEAKDKKKKAIPKAEQRHRNKKNIGKRRKPAGAQTPESAATESPWKAEGAKRDGGEASVKAVKPDAQGLAPLKRKPKPKH
jgi:hypothetical protein